MILKFSNIKLENINYSDLEMLRNVRNQNREFLINKKEISFEEQVKWFENLDGKVSTYLSICSSKTQVGFIYTKFLSDQDILETGILVDAESHESSVSALAAIMLSYYLLYKQSYKELQSTVHHKNTKAIAFNKKLGFHVCDIKGELIILSCTKESFSISNDKLLKRLNFGENLEVILS